MNGRPDVTSVARREVEVLEASRPRRESRGDSRLLVREAARAAPERQARHRRRGDGEEAAGAPGAAATAEPGEARLPGPRRTCGGSRGPRAAGPGAEVRLAAAAAGARPADSAAPAAAGEARRKREGALGEGRGVPDAEGDDQGAILGRRGAGSDRRGRDRDRRADGRHGPCDPACEGQDRADAGPRVGNRRADDVRGARGLHVRPDGARPRAGSDRVAVAGRPRARADEGRARQGRREEGAAAVIVRLMGEGQYDVDDEVAKGLNELDDQAAEALEAGDEERLSALLRRMADAVRLNGARLPDDDLSPSEAIVPPDDLSLAEARELFEGEGLIPDLPAA